MNENLPAGPEAAATAFEPAGCSRLGPAALRKWFVAYLLWLGALTAGALLCFQAYRQGTPAGLPLWAVSLGTFYLSLANGLVPLPTMWMVMLLASEVVGLPGSVPARIVLVATITAVATGMANLNEYHVLRWAMGSRVAGKVTQSRLVQWAIRWFRVSPFWILTMAAFVPLPIDAVRWLAIADGYSRLRFFGAYAVGRWVRYAVLAGATVWLHAGLKAIVGVQGGLLLAAAVPVAVRAAQRSSGKRLSVVKRANGSP